MTDKEIEELFNQNKLLQEENAYLKEQLDQLQRLIFGKKKETLSKVDADQLSLFDLPEETPEGLIEETVTTEIKGYQRTKKRYRLKDNLDQYPVEEVHHYLEGTDCQCPHCQQAMKEIGVAGHSDEVIFIPQQIKVRRHIQHSYVCSNYDEHEGDVFKKSELPKKPIQQSLASASMLTEVISQKFEYFVPLNRQEKKWQRMGIPLTRRTLSQWVITASESYLAPLFDLLHEKLLEEEVLMADETPVKSLASNKSKNYCWLTRTAADADRAIVLYHYDESRSGKVIKEILDGFSGYLQCDGYTGYGTVSGAILVHCLSHIRRKFFDSQSNVVYKGLACQAVELCDSMFEVERDIKRLKLTEHEAILKYRAEHLAPLLKKFQKWIDSHTALAKSALGEALNYARKYFPSLQAVLKDARLSLSNNLSECSLRQVALGRKNWLFSQSNEGARANTICFSIIQTATENGLNAWKYLNYLLTSLPNLPVLNKESLEAYLPWNSEVQAISR